MSLVVVYDSCVLHPAPLRDLLLRLARAGMVQPRWSALILDECFRSVLDRRPDLSPAALERTRAAMEGAFPWAMVSASDERVATLQLPDPDDRHVLAAALQGQASLILTFNLRDFPARTLAPLGVAAVHPDDFVLERCIEAPGSVLSAVIRQAAALKNPPASVDDVLSRLRVCGLPRSAAWLSAEMGRDGR